MVADLRKDDPTEEPLHRPVGRQERGLAPETEKTSIDSESGLAPSGGRASKSWGERRNDTDTMRARVDALESRLRELDEVSRRVVGEGE